MVVDRVPAGRVAPRPIRPATVLLAEDDDAVREFVRAALEFDGYAVVPAADGGEALDRFRAEPARFDLVLSDVLMPVRTGPELAAALAAIWPTARVLFMSAYVETASALPAGAELLEKPFTVAQLLAAVSRVL